MNPRISSSELISPELRSLLEHNPVVLLSGRPLTYDKGEKSIYYNDCPALIRIPILWSTVSVATIPDIGHRHLEPEFRGIFPAISGYHHINGDAFVFGVRPELQFSAELPE